VFAAYIELTQKILDITRRFIAIARCDTEPDRDHYENGCYSVCSRGKLLEQSGWLEKLVERIEHFAKDKAELKPQTRLNFVSLVMPMP